MGAVQSYIENSYFLLHLLVPILIVFAQENEQEHVQIHVVHLRMERGFKEILGKMNPRIQLWIKPKTSLITSQVLLPLSHWDPM